MTGVGSTILARKVENPTMRKNTKRSIKDVTTTHVDDDDLDNNEDPHPLSWEFRLDD